MIVGLDEKAAFGDTYAGADFEGETHAVAELTHARDLAGRAIQSSKALRDQILYTHQTLRPRTIADGFRIDAGQRLGGYVTNAL
jgi:hypothetical protein